MALRFSDGFDLYTSITDLPGRDWTVENSETKLAIGTTSGRYGGGALVMSDSSSQDSIRKFLVSGVSTSYTPVVGFSFKTASATTPTSSAFIGALTNWSNGDFFVEGNMAGMKFGVNINGEFFLDGYGFATPNHSGTVNICDGAWHWIEFAMKPSNTTGIMAGYVDGVAMPGNITSGDTYGSTYTIYALDTLIFATDTTQTIDYYIDDVIVYDDESSGITGDITYTSNFPIGDSRIETLQPSSAGNYSQWTPSIAVPNYQCVDEDNENGDTDYVETSTSGNKDTYAFGNLTASPVTIHACHVGIVGKATPGGTTDIKAMARSSSTDYEGASYTLGSGYTFTQTNVAQDPNTTAAWDEAGVNAAEFGFESQP